MTKLIITRGLPGSGKTTRAEAWVAEDIEHRARVNRDDLRTMTHSGIWLGDATEGAILAARDALIKAYLRRGKDVINDDTNLPQRTARDLAKLASVCHADFEVWDLTDVPLHECLARDSLREKPVGEDVIRQMYNRFLRGKHYPLPLPVEPEVELPEPELYVPLSAIPNAVVVDIDGTCALMDGKRGPHEYDKVHLDVPNRNVAQLVRDLRYAGYAILFVSGRTDACREETRLWLSSHVLTVADNQLFMRTDGDYRDDRIVKRELFDRHIRHNWNVLCVLDDRSKVVEMWRSLGLTCLQVAPGDF